MSKQSKIVLLIGSLTQEGVTTKIAALGCDYQQRQLSSKPDNWLKISNEISELRKSNELIAVFVHFTPSSIFRAAYVDYCQAWNSLLDELSATKSFVFVYEDILSGKLPDTGEYFDGPYRKFVSDDKAISIIRELYDRSIEVVPYRRRMDMTLRVQQALEDIEGGLFLRLYVPNGRLQSEQLVSLLRVLESYLQQVEQVSFSYDQRKTEHGIIYEFKSENVLYNFQDIDDALSRFENLMILAENAPLSAIKLLENKNIPASKATELIKRYTRDYRRLKQDIRHEYELKSLALRQNLENEVLDHGELISNGGLPLHEASRLLSSLGSSIVINVNSPLINANNIINSELAHIINGDIQYTPEDTNLLALFNEYADRLEQIILKTSLNQIKDETVPPEERQTAKQKVMSFLYKILPTVGEKSVEILIDYVMKKAMGG